MNDLMDDEEKMSKKQKQNTDSATPVLDNFSRDLNKLAEQGKLDPVIGRDREILRRWLGYFPDRRIRHAC